MASCFKIAQLALERAHPSFPILCCLAREQDVSPDKRVPAAIAHGTDWIERYPWIATAALKNRQKHFVVEGEEVVLGVDDVSDFNALHSLPGSFNFPSPLDFFKDPVAMGKQILAQFDPSKILPKAPNLSMPDPAQPY